MSFPGRRRSDALLQPLVGSPPTAAMSSAHHQHAERQQLRAQQAGLSPVPGRTGGGAGGSGAAAVPGRFPAPGRSAPRPIIPQQAVLQRQKDKFVALPEDEEDATEGVAAAAAAAAAAALASGASDAPPGSLVSDEGAQLLAQLSDAAGITDEMALQTLAPGLFQDLPPSMVQQPPGGRGRITLYGLAEDFDRDRLHEVLCASFPPAAIKVFPDAFAISYAPSSSDAVGADVFCFDYGVVACWGLDAQQETSFVRNIASHALNTASGDGGDGDHVEIDQFQFQVSTTERPHIQNDLITLHRKAAADHKVKLAISYALSQSTKLSLYEKRVTDLVLESKHLPEQLAETGEVKLTSEEVAMLIGRVFLHRAAVNLLGSVLDTPEFFWREADSYQALYGRICEYLELGERVEVLNARFSVLQEMLDMLRDHLNNQHSSRLEVIVIVLIFVEVVVGLVELVGLFGWFNKK